MRRVLQLLSLLILTGLAGTVGAQGRAPIHVQIVLDSSGSMKDNDPKRLSSLAGMIFSDLAGPNDAVGILTMQKNEFVREEIAPIGKRRKVVRESVKSLPFLGSTFCAEPLEAAADGLSKMRAAEPDARQFVIFLSDGVCPNDHQQGPEAVREAARALGTAGVKIFSIGLFGPQAQAGPDPTADLRAMASLTDGEFFSASRAADLPQRFASILGRIVGSEAQVLSMEPGADVQVSLDGYVYDASLILTGARPIVLQKAEGPLDTSLELPRRAPTSVTSDSFHLASFGNAQGSHYSVLRIEEPAAGGWTFNADGPGLYALLIQNYALDPVLELTDPRNVYAVGEEVRVSGWLNGRRSGPSKPDDNPAVQKQTHERIDDEGFLQRVEFTVTLLDPDGKEHQLVLKPDERGLFSGARKLDVAGQWAMRARARMLKGGLDKRTDKVRFDVRDMKFALAPNHPPIDLGEIRAGEESGPHQISFEGSDFPTNGSVSLTTEGMPGIRRAPSEIAVGPKTLSGTVTFVPVGNHEGGPIDGKLVLEMHGQRGDVSVRGTVIPLSFWERYGRLIITIAVALLVLALLLFIIYGFVSPHRFPADARLNWGESLDRLKKNEILISEIPGTKSGFYKNAKLIVGGPGSFLPADGAVLAEIEAMGASQIVIRSPNVELHKVNKFDETKTKAVDNNEAGMHSGEIYQVGKIYLRLR